MNSRELEDFRLQLLGNLKEIDQMSEDNLEARAIVELDQQSVGRLSRIDALQQQAMAKATEARRAALRQRTIAALERISEGEFGFCADCGDEIEQKRLVFDPSIAICLDCSRS